MSFGEPITAITPVVETFERLGVRYYVGGSVASMVYGQSRTTLDADLVADLALNHVAPLVAALSPDYYVSESMISDAVARRSSFNVIYLLTSFKVDVFVVKSRQYDQVALQRIRKDSLDEEHPSRQFFLASPEDVVLNKLEWFRLGDEVSERQWHDVVGVLKVQENRMDRSYLAKWAAELGVGDLLQRAWQEAATSP